MQAALAQPASNPSQVGQAAQSIADNLRTAGKSCLADEKYKRTAEFFAGLATLATADQSDAVTVREIILMLGRGQTPTQNNPHAAHPQGITLSIVNAADGRTAGSLGNPNEDVSNVFEAQAFNPTQPNTPLVLRVVGRTKNGGFIKSGNDTLDLKQTLKATHSALTVIKQNKLPKGVVININDGEWGKDIGQKLQALDCPVGQSSPTKTAPNLPNTTIPKTPPRKERSTPQNAPQPLF